MVLFGGGERRCRYQAPPGGDPPAGPMASDIFELARLLELVLKEINALLKIGT